MSPLEVSEAAAIAVPAEPGEDEILAAVVPRYIVFVDELPHTPAHRVAKFGLEADRTIKERAVDLGAA